MGRGGACSRAGGLGGVAGWCVGWGWAGTVPDAAVQAEVVRVLVLEDVRVLVG